MDDDDDVYGDENDAEELPGGRGPRADSLDPLDALDPLGPAGAAGDETMSVLSDMGAVCEIDDAFLHLDDDDDGGGGRASAHSGSDKDDDDDASNLFAPDSPEDPPSPKKRAKKLPQPKKTQPKRPARAKKKKVADEETHAEPDPAPDPVPIEPVFGARNLPRWPMTQTVQPAGFSPDLEAVLRQRDSFVRHNPGVPGPRIAYHLVSRGIEHRVVPFLLHYDPVGLVQRLAQPARVEGPPLSYLSRRDCGMADTSQLAEEILAMARKIYTDRPEDRPAPVHCHWCTLPIEGAVLPHATRRVGTANRPVGDLGKPRELDHYYVVTGMYCSAPCVLAGARGVPKGTMLSRQMLKDVYGVPLSQVIKAAPDRFLLRQYGGPLTPEQYRATAHLPIETELICPPMLAPQLTQYVEREFVTATYAGILEESDLRQLVDGAIQLDRPHFKHFSNKNGHKTYIEPVSSARVRAAPAARRQGRRRRRRGGPEAADTSFVPPPALDINEQLRMQREKVAQENAFLQQHLPGATAARRTAPKATIHSFMMPKK